LQAIAGFQQAKFFCKSTSSGILGAKAKKISPKEENPLRAGRRIIGYPKYQGERFAHENPSCCGSVPVSKRVFSGFDETLIQHGNKTGGL